MRAVTRGTLQKASGQHAGGERRADEHCRLPPRELFRVPDEVLEIALAQPARELLDPIRRPLGVLRDRVLLLVPERARALPNALRQAAQAIRRPILLLG